MGKTSTKFFANGLSTPQKVSICHVIIILLLHLFEIIHPHANANSYCQMSRSNGGRILAKSILAQLEEVGDMRDVGREAKMDPTEYSTHAPAQAHQMAWEMKHMTPSQHMDSTNSHIPTKHKTINQGHMHISTSDEAFLHLRRKINSYINKHNSQQTNYNKGNIKTDENIKKNVKLFERKLKKQMNTLNFYVSKKDMYILWGNAYDRRRHIYIHMINKLWDKCVQITEKNQIPKNFLFKIWWKAYSDLVQELQNYDSLNLNSFYQLYYKDRCPRYTYVEFIMENKKSWKTFTKSMKNKWTNNLLHELYGYYK
ncbi:hypothetical protein AK88_03000 [Plasmodium fragile]|uniref:Plasmodium RESA N-terminal domain-containing protein n=1 Tax=Plasmodium fragile TaxID=5857 RepID=A0A0D9QJT0_PLAFR|nr:uncharacterized protein AK88_03000 [Plasmodium fragile]KJP87320.1 hypothetical protein AK88_03000 [Plasmodium fragile]